VDAPDEVGVELPDLDAARQLARHNLRFTASEVIKEQGKLVPNHRIQIEDADGHVLDTIYVGDVVKVETDPRFSERTPA
jgi:hypothetical protein